MDKRNIIKFDKFKSFNINKWIDELSNFSKREAKETNIAYKILIKMILSFFDKSVDKPNHIEIKFLQLHCKDLIKILILISTGMTPIPYILIAIILKKFKINLLPSKDDLKIPDEFKHIK
jgi:hypothetical protein